MERGDAMLSHSHASQMINNNVPRQMRVSDQTELEVNAPCLPYRPQRGCEDYVFTGVCLSTRGGGWGCLPQCMLGYHPPPEQTPPRDTVTAADGTHPTGMHSCLF